MTFKKLKTNFERELLFQIIQNLRKERLTHDSAQSLAKEFLPLLRSETSEDFINKVSKLSEKHPEILEAFLISVKDYEKDHITDSLETARTKISSLITNHQSPNHGN